MNSEQQRIVAKVDELMRWCDALEARLTTTQTTAAELDALLPAILPSSLRFAATSDRAFTRLHVISARRAGEL